MGRADGSGHRTQYHPRDVDANALSVPQLLLKHALLERWARRDVVPPPAVNGARGQRRDLLRRCFPAAQAAIRLRLHSRPRAGGAGAGWG